MLRDVLRDGFEYTAGRTMSLDELKSRVAHRRAERGRARRKVA